MRRILRITLAWVLALALLLSACGEIMTTSKKQNLFNAALGELEAYLMDLNDDPVRLDSIAKQFKELGGFPQKGTDTRAAGA